MKKILKRVLTLLTMLLICGAICFGVMASDSEDTASERKEGVANSYIILDKFGAQVGEIYTPGESATDALRQAFNNAADGQTIRLLGDMLMNTTAIFTPNGKTLFVDLNGYSLGNFNTNTSQNPYFIRVSSNSNTNFYSSDENYTAGMFVMNIYNASGNMSSQSMLQVAGSNSYVRLGTPVRDENGDVTGYTDCNINTFGSNLVEINSSATNSRVEIYGGSHARTYHMQHKYLLMLNGAGSIYARDAKFYAYDSYILGAGIYSTSDYIANATATFENCLFYSSDVVANSVHENAADGILFKNCDFICSTVSMNSGAMNYENCRFSDSVSQNISDVKINEIETVELVTNTFSFKNFVLNESSLDMIKSTQTVKFALISDDAAHASVTWKFNDETVTEKWAVGQTPISPFSPYESTDVYRYKYIPDIKTVSTEDAANGIIYELKPVVQFPVKQTVSLYASFVYNVYLPKAQVDSGDINYAMLDGSVIEASGTENIDGSLFYLYEIKISAFQADDEFLFSINVDGYEDTTFTQAYPLSVTSYMEAISNGNYSDDAKALANSTVTYIKAAANYSSGSETLPYPIEENEDLQSLTNVTGSPSSFNSTMASVFWEAVLSLDDGISFRFYIKNVSDEYKKVTFTYKSLDDSSYTDLRLSADDWTATTLSNGEPGYYYDLEVRARDLRDNIYITLGHEEKESYDHTFCLDHYIYDMQNYDDDTLKTLLNALYAYSIAAGNYVSETDEVITPTITVGTQTVTGDTYVIEAPDVNFAPAVKLQAAILSLTGEELEIITGATEKKKIILDVSAPSFNNSYDFIASVDGDSLVLSSFASFIEKATDNFISEYLTARNSLTFSADFNDLQYTDKIYYSDFGAVSHKKPTLAKNNSDTSNGGTTNVGTYDSDVLDTEEDKAIRAANFKAINATHEYANMTGRHTVCADFEVENPIYWIKEATVDGVVTTISIKSDVNWNGATFIIDNSCLNPVAENGISHSETYGSSIFIVESNFSKTMLDSAYIDSCGISITPDTTTINLNLGYPAMIVPTYSGHKVFRRRGYSSYAGESQTEIIVINENGTVNDETPIMWSYADVNSIDVYRIDVEPLTIEGGTFTTIASQKNNANKSTNTAADTYFSRNLSVRRSNTTVLGVEHYTENEIPLRDRDFGVKVGAPQSGFFHAVYASYVTFKDCVLTGQRCYARPQRGTTGTYDFGAGYVNKIVLDGCTQSNFWITLDSKGEAVPANEATDGAVLSMDGYSWPGESTGQMHWGVGKTNFCKNLEYINSTISRFDAHCGLYNGKIINSTVNGISLTGMGDMIIENSKIYSDIVASLRGDYGYTWDGVISVSNSSVYAPEGVKLLSFNYVNWYYGYQVAFPSLSIENVDFYYADQKTVSDGTVSYTEFTSDEVIALSGYDFINGEYNLHLSETAKSHPYRNPSSSNTSGVEDTTSYENLNPVKPPEYIYISDADYEKYTFDIPFDAPFFANTRRTRVKYEVKDYWVPVVDVIVK